jgi:hypothetical protein
MWKNTYKGFNHSQDFGGGDSVTVRHNFFIPQLDVSDFFCFLEEFDWPLFVRNVSLTLFRCPLRRNTYFSILVVLSQCLVDTRVLAEDTVFCRLCSNIWQPV